MENENVDSQNNVFGRIIFKWIENKNSVRNIIFVLILVCFILFCLDFFFHRHGHFNFEETPTFFSIYGFVMFSLIIFGAKFLRLIVKRDENYYGKRAIDSEILEKNEEK
jgi:hypothetical protein